MQQGSKVPLLAAACPPKQVALGDRPISITVARTWHALTLWEKAKLLASLLFTGMAPTRPQTLKAEIERMKVRWARHGLRWPCCTTWLGGCWGAAPLRALSCEQQ